MTKNKIAGKSGFTLLEMLLVIAIIAILASIVIVAINPAKQLGDTYDAQRRSDVRAVLDAVHQYSVDNNAVITALGIDNSDQLVEETDGTVTGICQWLEEEMTGIEFSDTNLESVLVPTYLADLPSDPGGSEDYLIAQDALNKRIAVCAPGAEQTTYLGVFR